MRPFDYAAEYATFDAITAVRALTRPEQERLDRITRAECHRRWRRERQIAAARERIDRMLADLSSARQLRELRAEAIRAAERLRALEDRLEPGARLERIEDELGLIAAPGEDAGPALVIAPPEPLRRAA